MQTLAFAIPDLLALFIAAGVFYFLSSAMQAFRKRGYKDGGNKKTHTHTLNASERLLNFMSQSQIKIVWPLASGPWHVQLAFTCNAINLHVTHWEVDVQLPWELVKFVSIFIHSMLRFVRNEALFCTCASYTATR